MTPEQAWQATLSQLQMEMPKATFDTWVRETKLVAYTAENQPMAFTLGFINAYARDWVENRLASTLRQILMGMLDKEVALKFEVIPTQTETLPAPYPEGTSDVPVTNPGDEARFTLLRTSLEEAILLPERIVAVPGYFLRWLPYLGPSRAWVVVALRQAFYETYGKTAFANAPFEASGEQVARWAGMTRQTFQNYLAELDSDPLAWFVSRGESSEGQTNTYRFRLTMPLTPGDADRLRDWLVMHGAKTNPQKALEQALTLQPKEILPYPALVPTAEQKTRPPNPQTISQVVLETAQLHAESERFPLVMKLAKKLEARLMPPPDQLIISHYFLLHWLRLLGPGPAWMITLLRDQCYHNHQTGELRDTIALNDGYRDLAQALGIERTKTIGEWLFPLDEMARRGRKEKPSVIWQQRQEKRGWVAQFLEKTDFHFDHAGRKTTHWKLKVSQADPLTPAHTHALALLSLLTQSADRGESEWLETILDDKWNKEVEARFLQGWGAFLTGSKEVEARFSQGWGAFLTGSKEVGARFLQGLGRDFDTLKLLIKHYNLKPLIKPLPPHFPRASEPEEEPDQGVGMAYPEQWNFEKLLEMGSVPKAAAQQTLERIAKNPMGGTHFLAWVMYGYVHKGASNEEKGIRNPILFANSRAGALPDPTFLELAKRTPRELARLKHPWQRYTIPVMSRSQSEALEALINNGFFTILEFLAKEGEDKVTPP